MFSLNQNFPQLKKITFGFAEIVNMRDFFRMNQQLTIYNESSCTTRIFKNIVELLPNIEILNLTLMYHVNFEHVDRLETLNSLSITSLPYRNVVLRNFSCVSLQHLYLSHFNLGHATTDISQLINLKIFKLHKCTINIDYIIEIVKDCTELTEIHVLQSCNCFPSTNQLIEIVKCGEKMEKLIFIDVYQVEIVSFEEFMHLTQILQNRQKKIFISIGKESNAQIVQSFTNTNIELQYT